MNRRSLLRRAAAFAVLPALPRPVRVALAENAPTRRVRPSDPAWPGEASWAKLNQAVGGRLINVNSPLSACRDASDGAACGDLFKQLKNPYYIGDNVADADRGLGRCVGIAAERLCGGSRDNE